MSEIILLFKFFAKYEDMTLHLRRLRLGSLAAATPETEWTFHRPFCEVMTLWRIGGGHAREKIDFSQNKCWQRRRQNLADILRNKLVLPSGLPKFGMFNKRPQRNVAA